MGKVITLLLALLLTCNSWAEATDDNYTLPSGEDTLTVGGGVGEPPPPGESLEGSVYVVDSSAPGGGNGLTVATAWNNVSDISGLSASDRICFMDDSEFPERFLPPVSGIAGDRAINGTCYVDSGDGNKLRWYNEGTGTGRGAKAIFRGTYGEPCGAGYGPTSACPIDTGSARPTNKANGMIQLNNRQYVTIQDLDVRDSSGIGILVVENFNPSHTILQRNNITNTVWWGIKIENAASGGGNIVRQNTLDYISLIFEDNRAGNWPGCITIQSDNSETRFSQSLIEENVMENCAGEGISLLRVSRVIVRGNDLAHSRRFFYYNDNGIDNVWEHNKASGGSYAPRSGGSRRDSACCYHGFGLAVEEYQNCNLSKDSTGVVFRNNIFANVMDAFRVFRDAGCSDEKISGYVYGNTFTLTNSKTDNGYFQQSNTGLVDFELYNNLFVTDSTNTPCEWGNFGAIDDLDYNQFKQDPDGNQWCDQGANTVVDVSPGFSNNDTWGVGNLPSENDVRPTVNLGTGNALTGDIADHTKYSEIFSELSKDVCDILPADWDKKMEVDYECTSRPANPTKGALEP